MTVSPNGVAITEFDPIAVGAIVFAGVEFANIGAGDIALGQDVDAAAVKLRPACTVNIPSNAALNVVSTIGAVLPGTWRCLGHLNMHSGIPEAATLWMRVA